MFRETLKIRPQLEPKDLSAMERSLNSRFARVAKRFGSGLVTALKGGGITAAAIALIDKLLNPLKEVQESIERTLNTADQATTQAGQFNTTSGSLFRLQRFAQAKGLDPNELNVLITKFQGAVAQAAADPSKRTAVSNYIGKKDTAEAFFEFIQAVQKLDPTKRTLVQQEVFGEKQILKMAEFLQADFAQLDRMLGGPTAEELTKSLEKLGMIEDVQSALRARRELLDIEKKSKLIGPNQLYELNRGEDLELQRENKRLAQFDDLKKISIASDKVVKMLEDFFLKLAPQLAVILPAALDQISGTVKAIEKSRAARGMLPGKDDN